MPPIFIARASGEVEPVVTRGMPLGMSTFQAGYAERPFGQGDRVFVFTDGLSEMGLPNGRPLGLPVRRVVSPGRIARGALRAASRTDGAHRGAGYAHHRGFARLDD